MRSASGSRASWTTCSTWRGFAPGRLELHPRELSTELVLGAGAASAVAGRGAISGTSRSSWTSSRARRSVTADPGSNRPRADQPRSPTRSATGRPGRPVGCGRAEWTAGCASRCRTTGRASPPSTSRACSRSSTGFRAPNREAPGSGCPSSATWSRPTAARWAWRALPGAGTVFWIELPGRRGRCRRRVRSPALELRPQGATTGSASSNFFRFRHSVEASMPEDARRLVQRGGGGHHPQDVLALDLIEGERSSQAQGPRPRWRRSAPGTPPGEACPRARRWPRAPPRCAARARFRARDRTRAPRPSPARQLQPRPVERRRELPEHPPRQGQDVLPPLAQRRHADLHHVEAVEQVLAEPCPSGRRPRARGWWPRRCGRRRGASASRPPARRPSPGGSAGAGPGWRARARRSRRGTACRPRRPRPFPRRPGRRR